MGSRRNCPNKTTLERVPEKLLRHLYQDVDMTDRAIAQQLGVNRKTIKSMREYYEIPSSPKIKGILEWHKNRTKRDIVSAVHKNWNSRRENGTDKLGIVPKSAFKIGNDNGKKGKTHEELFGKERAKNISVSISKKMTGRFAGKKNPMFGKLPMNKKNNHRGGYIDSPLQGKVWMRSSWEIEYANHLTSLKIKWLYESKCFDLGNGRTYRPDFYLTATDEWHEVKGYLTDLDRAKMSLMKSIYNIQVKIIGLNEMKLLNLRIRPIKK